MTADDFRRALCARLSETPDSEKYRNWTTAGSYWWVFWVNDQPAEVLFREVPYKAFPVMAKIVIEGHNIVAEWARQDWIWSRGYVDLPDTIKVKLALTLA